MTAVQLLWSIRDAGCEPAVEGEALVFDTDPPARFARYLDALHTGVRAALTGRRWYGIEPRTGRACGPHPTRGAGPLAFGALDPARPLPPAVGLLSVEGDSCWDRLPAFARTDFPALFAPDIATPAPTR